SHWQIKATFADPSIGPGRIAWSPNGEKIASVNEDQTVRVWDVATGQNTDIFKNPDIIHDMAWSPDSKLIATASADHNVYLWEVKPGTNANANTPSPGTP